MYFLRWPLLAAFRGAFVLARAFLGAVGEKEWPRFAGKDMDDNMARTRDGEAPDVPCDCMLLFCAPFWSLPRAERPLLGRTCPMRADEDVPLSG